jgi:chemotaxis protein methyltransferase CheR
MGLALSGSGLVDLEKRIERHMISLDLTDVAAYQRHLQSEARFLDDLVDQITVGETSFFRDEGHFQLIAREVLPDLRRRRPPGHVVRVWSAGCASGEEAYSLAMMMEDELGGHASVLATDISRTALARAGEASYGQWSLRGPGAKRALPYLVSQGPRRYRVGEAMRGRVRFERLNLAADGYPSAVGGIRDLGIHDLDLILCRNVLIYLHRKAIAAIARRLHDSLAEGGWLIVGPSDPPLADAAPFEVVVREEGVFYRRPARAEVAAWPAPPPGRPPGPTAPPPEISRPHPGPTHPPVTRPLEAPAALDDVAGAAARVRALASSDGTAAQLACAHALRAHPLSEELHLLQAALLFENSRLTEAAAMARRALFLDRSLVVGHFLLGSILAAARDRDGARQAFVSAARLARRLPPAEPLPLADGEPAGRLLAAAEMHIARLDRPGEDAPE